MCIYRNRPLVITFIGVLIWMAMEHSLVIGVTYKIPLIYSRSNTVSKQNDSAEVKSKELQKIGLSGESGQGYYIRIAIGNPPQFFNVLVDTGSSNFAIAAAPHPVIKTYFNPNRSRTFKYFDATVFVPYTQGNWEGSLGIDDILMTAAPSISVMANIALIKTSEKFFINGSNWQGILGLAYSAIARPNSSVTPFFDSLVNTRNVSNVFSLQLCGHNALNNSASGMMTIGGIDSKLYFGNITYAPLHQEGYYELVLTQLSIDGLPIDTKCQELNSDRTIVDSGTTNLRLPKRVFSKVIDVFKKLVVLDDIDVQQFEKFWFGESVMCWTFGNTPWNVFPFLKLSVAHGWNSAFTLIIPPQQYLRIVEEDDAFSKNRSCYKFAVSPSDSGTVLGSVIMEGFYLIFDRKNKRIGFAKSTCPHGGNMTSNSHILGPFPFNDALQCGDIRNNSAENQALLIVAYVMAGLCGLCLVPLIIISHKWFSNLLTHKHMTDPQCNQSDTASLVEQD